MCVLIKPNSPLHVEIVELDVNGRFIILCLKTPGEINLNVVNVYAPTDPREQIDFINSFSKKIISLTNTSSVIIAGDWNATLNSLDKQGGLTWKETNYRNSLVHFMKEANLVDIYRKFHPKSKSYTNESKPLKLKSRIDFFLISGEKPVKFFFNLERRNYEKKIVSQLQIGGRKILVRFQTSKQRNRKSLWPVLQIKN